MGFKNWPSWLKGGVTLTILSIIFYFLGLFLLTYLAYGFFQFKLHFSAIFKGSDVWMYLIVTIILSFFLGWAIDYLKDRTNSYTLKGFYWGVLIGFILFVIMGLYSFATFAMGIGYGLATNFSNFIIILIFILLVLIYLLIIGGLGAFIGWLIGKFKGVQNV